ncbi:hypothetical protein OAT93_01745 [bacterium]|nr:hypothetical protein [bacterium]
MKSSISRLERMKKGVLKVSIQEFKEESQLLGDLNRSQLNEGLDANGKPTPNYAESSKKSGRIRFKDTGKYTEGIKPLFEGDGFQMTSTDEKRAFLNPWKKVVETLGVTVKNLYLVLVKIKPRIVNKLLRL